MTGPLNIQIVTPEEAEEVSYLICCRQGVPTPLTGNLTGSCCACGSTVIFRPSAPKKPPRLCLQCAADILGATKQ